MALFLFIAVHAAQAEPSGKDKWDTFIPPPDSYDWVQFNSMEWLRGELKFLYSDDLEFESEELGKHSIDLSDVLRIRTSCPREVTIAGVDNDPAKVFIGKIEVEKAEIKITCNKDVHIFPIARLLSIAYGEQVESKQWSGKVTLGGNSRSGNSQELELNFKVGVKKRTSKSRFALDYSINWSENLDVQTVDNQRLQFYRDALSAKRTFWRQLVTEYFRDPFNNIDGRLAVGTGLGYHVIEDQDERWTLSLGGGYQKTRYSSFLVGTDNSNEAPYVFFSSEYDRDITNDIELEIEYRFHLTDEESGTYVHHSMVNFSNDLGNNMSLEASFVWDRTKDPVADSNGVIPEKDDFRFLLGLGYDL